MKPPYANGAYTFDGDEANADNDPTAGINYSVAYSATIEKGYAVAWAEAHLGSKFEIVHSRNYNIAFSFCYRGRAQYRIKQTSGLVNRLTSRNREALGKFIGGFQSMLDGEVKAFTSEVEKT